MPYSDVRFQLSHVFKYMCMFLRAHIVHAQLSKWPRECSQV